MLPGHFIEKTISEGLTILSYQKRQDRSYMEAYSFEGIFEGMPAIVVNRGIANSQTFDGKYEPAKHVFMISYVRRGHGQYTVSLYSTNPSVHCGQIAKRYGGGGHKGAAGFHVNGDPVSLGLIREI